MRSPLFGVLFGALALGAVLVPPTEAWAQGAQDGAAQVRFQKGRELFLANDFAAALVEFRAANELLASPNTRLYIARCERELGHFASAYLEFQRAASEASDRAPSDPRYASTRDVARQEGAALEGKLGRLTVKAGEGAAHATITVGGKPLGAAALGVATPIDAGAVEIAATAPGMLPFKKTLEVKAGKTAELVVTLERDPNAVETPPPPPPPVGGEPPQPPPEATPEKSGGGVRIAGVVVLGVGVVGFVSFAALAASAKSTYDKLLAECGGPCDTSYEPRIQSGETQQLAANVMLGVGIAGLVVGGVMVALGGPKSASASAPATSTALKPIFTPLAGGGFLGVQRAF
jgi:hypothetical protein